MQARPAWSCPLLVPSGSETASTALTSAIFPYQVDFQSDHLAHFSSSFASGGHKNNPTSHGFTAFSGAEGLNAAPPRTGSVGGIYRPGSVTGGGKGTYALMQILSSGRHKP